MRKSTTINLNSLKIVSNIKANYSTIIFLLIFVVGVTIGTLLIKYNPTITIAAETIFREFLSERISSGFFKVLLVSFLNLLPLYLVIFLSGTSLIGVVLVPISICYKGVIFGIVSSYLYVAYMLRGIAFNALLFVPTNLVAVLTLIFSAKISFSFSLILLKSSLPRGQSVNLHNQFQSYFKKYTVCIVFLGLSAIIDALMSYGFIRLFNF